MGLRLQYFLCFELICIFLARTANKGRTIQNQNQRSEKQEKGNDGKPGKPGFPGGKFYGEGKLFIKMEDLTINVSGGKGGSGQNGGNGADGRQGSQQIMTKKIKLLDQTLLKSRKLVKWNSSATEVIKTFTTFNSSYEEIFQGFQSGTIGGDGGDGGIGGFGGKQGCVQLTAVKQNSKQNVNGFKILKQTGERGNNGKGGIGGKGGKNSSLITATYTNQYILPMFRGIKTTNQQQTPLNILPFFQTGVGIAVIVTARTSGGLVGFVGGTAYSLVAANIQGKWQTNITPRNDFAQNGKQAVELNQNNIHLPIEQTDSINLNFVIQKYKNHLTSIRQKYPRFLINIYEN